MWVHLALLSAILVLAPTEGACAPADRWREQFDAGVRVYNAGDLESARARWEAALPLAEALGRTSSEHMQTLHWLANLEESAGNLAKA